MADDNKTITDAEHKAKKMIIYKALQNTPQEAQKSIGAGRLKGFTDINPMWRIKRMTEIFGPCGFGWWIDIVSLWSEPGADGEQKAFAKINLYVKTNDRVSQPIPGVGGSSFVTNEKSGPYTSDECYKSAISDAIGSACKMLGMSADIYFSKGFRTKYDTPQEATPTKTTQPNADGDFQPKCKKCGKDITIAEHDYSVKQFKQPLCRACQKEA